MSARNKLPAFKSLLGKTGPTLIKLPVQAGATQAIKLGEICNLHNIDIASHPIVPVSAHDSGMVPLIAWQEQGAADPARHLMFALPQEGDLFEFDLNTATALKMGDDLHLDDSQTVAKSSSTVVGSAWVEPLADGSWQSVSKVFVHFNRCTGAGLTNFPLIGLPATVTTYTGDVANPIADPGTGVAIPVTESGTVPLTIADAAQTNTLAVPTFAGQQLLIAADTRAGTGSRVITVADPHIDGTNNTITFDAAGETVLLIGVKVGATFAWKLVVNVGATLSHV